MNFCIIVMKQSGFSPSYFSNVIQCLTFIMKIMNFFIIVMKQFGSSLSYFSDVSQCLTFIIKVINCCREGPVKDTNTTVYHVSKIILTSTSEQTFSTFIHTCKQDR